MLEPAAAAGSGRARVKLSTGKELRVRPDNLSVRHECSRCGDRCEKLRACSKCAVAAYCGKDCQVIVPLRVYVYACASPCPCPCPLSLCVFDACACVRPVLHPLARKCWSSSNQWSRR